jgi:hypothetical protein
MMEVAPGIFFSPKRFDNQFPTRQSISNEKMNA